MLGMRAATLQVSQRTWESILRLRSIERLRFSDRRLGRLGRLRFSDGRLGRLGFRGCS